MASKVVPLMSLFGNRMFNNKYKLAEQHRRRSALAGSFGLSVFLKFRNVSLQELIRIQRIEIHAVNRLTRSIIDTV